MVLTCCGPGLFAGDQWSQSIRIEAGACVHLASQSALQIHPTRAPGAAQVRSRFSVDAEGELDCQWDPTIPFQGARLDHQVDIELAPGGRLFWSDALMAGRIARGEVWRFDQLKYELNVSRAGSLDYLERYDLRPMTRGVARPWAAGSARYIGTLIASHEEVGQGTAERLQQRLDQIPGVQAGVDIPSGHFLVGRVTAEQGPPFARARATFRSELGRPTMRR